MKATKFLIDMLCFNSLFYCLPDAAVEINENLILQLHDNEILSVLKNDEGWNDRHRFCQTKLNTWE